MASGGMVPKIVIIGGGISGMAAAFRLKHDHGLDSVVLESGDRPGGKAQTECVDGFTCERGTNSWLDKEPAARELLRDLGIYDRIQPADETAERRFIFRDGSLREIYLHPLKFMMSSVLPLGARLRLAIEPIIKKRTDDTDETLADFAARRLGKGARDVLISPMASGVYAGDPAQLSVKSCFPKVCALEERHGSLIKGMVALKREKKRAGEDPSTVQAGPSGRITSLKGGVSDLVRALADNLEESMRLGRKVSSVSAGQDGGFSVHLGGGESICADAVVSAAPAWAAASYLETLDGEASRAFGEIPYPALDVVCLGFRAEQVGGDLNGFGFLVPRGQDKTILGSLWTSSIFPGRAPDGCVLIRTMIGGMLEPQVAGWTEDQVVDTVRRELEDILGIDQSETPVFQRVFRHERAIPQYHVGHDALVSRIRRSEDRYPGLFNTGNALGGIGVIDCIREAVPMAQRVADFIRQRSNSS
ncbi:MAG: protoporphyrinogen oxidase [Deltaproteobacteria bacterium]|nr:protoporphyrinogen oxidase [Deltaproteobacteria bacterium]